jgi:hypothetical protein
MRSRLVPAAVVAALLAVAIAAPVVSAREFGAIYVDGVAYRTSVILSSSGGAIIRWP